VKLIKYPQKFGFTLYVCFRCNLASEYSSVGYCILVLAVVNVTGH